MLTLDQIRHHLSDRRLSKVAEATGLHYQTVRKVANDKAITPDYQTVKALSDYLEAQMGK